MTPSVAAEAVLWSTLLVSTALLTLAAVLASRTAAARASVLSTLMGLCEFSVSIAMVHRVPPADTQDESFS